MLALSKLIPRQLNQCITIGLNTTGQRTIFAPSYYGCDSFKRHAEYLERQQGTTMDTIRTTINQALEKPDKNVFTEDLKTFLYLTKNETDFQTVIKAFERYTTQKDSPVFTYNFDAPLMRLGVTINRTNELLELFLNHPNNLLNKSFTPAFILANKLYAERRYDDVIKVFHKTTSTYKDFNKRFETPNGSNFFSKDLIHVVAESLLEKNDDEALKEIGGILKITNDTKTNINNRTRCCLVLLALNRGNAELAYELSVNNLAPKISGICINLKIIALSHLGRVNEALTLVNQRMTEQIGQFSNQLFFKFNLDSLAGSIKKGGDASLQPEVDAALSKMQTMLMPKDIREFATETVSERRDINNNERLNGGTGNMRNFNRNDQSNQGNQFNQGGRFQQQQQPDNRFNNQNGRFEQQQPDKRFNNQNRSFGERRSFDNNNENVNNPRRSSNNWSNSVDSQDRRQDSFGEKRQFGHRAPQRNDNRDLTDNNDLNFETEKTRRSPPRSRPAPDFEDEFDEPPATRSFSSSFKKQTRNFE